ncbi:MAG: von Willebrand factor type A domain-containing protein [Bacteroidetes bacterium]|nr:von Willebrand factor type A domain-containing protein [Bacteroidota bacterium]
MKNVFLISILAVIFNLNLAARTITGTVISSEDGSVLPGVSVCIKANQKINTTTDNQGKYSIEANNEDILVFSFIGFATQEVKVGKQSIINVALECEKVVMDDVVIMECEEKEHSIPTQDKKVLIRGVSTLSKNAQYGMPSVYYPQEPFNREGYSAIHENGFKEAIKAPLSTFSIDVDAASYANVRRFLNNGQKPPVDAVRIEEMINYFNYDYPQPDNGHPFAIYQELAHCPWNEENMLLHIGLQGEKIEMENLPPSNIVFLLDVSGSMSSPNKLPLLKKAFKLLVQQLREEDRVAIVVYAGSSGLVLPSTSCDKKESILNALENLHAGGSTAGAAGLKLAYQVASEHFIKGGNNRIILATDGDFNVGQSSNAEMERLIEKEREKGIFISVLGFGMGNYQDDKMEIIADKGNGNYAYIDNILEAKKVLVNEFGGTLFTIAKDVKIQIEFNPAIVESYRLIGYENRLLNNEDFEDDKKDAGELGSGHTVTALYEIKLANTTSLKKNDLKYQSTNLNSLAKEGDEVATVKFRYKKPNGQKSILLEEIIPFENNYITEMSDNFKFSAAVASFGMLLRNSEYKGNSTYKSVIDLAQSSKGKDAEGYRSEFIQLIKLSEQL